MMFHRVEVGSQIEINHIGLALENRFRYALEGNVRGLLRSVAKRPRLKIGFKDRFQDELQCSLNHSVSDRWHGQRELHLRTTRIWDGLRSVTLSTCGSPKPVGIQKIEVSEAR